MKRRKRTKPSRPTRAAPKTPQRKRAAHKASAKPAARKASRKPGAPRRRTPDTIDTLVTASAEALSLPIDPAWGHGVKFNVQLILRLAALVDEFPLADDTEPGPVFHA